MKIMNKISELTTLVIFCAISTVVYAQTTNNSRPNIIVILADDLGYGDVGFNRDSSFPEDLGIIPTPNLDALAQNGIIFKNAHVAHPFCGPSRVAIMTGMMPHRIGAQYNLPNNINGTLGPSTAETYFPKLLQDAGYNTAAIGKWHLGFVENLYQPQDRGFDYFFGFLGGGKQYFESDYEDSWYNNPSQTNEYRNPLRRNRNYISIDEFSDNGDEDYLTDILTDDAIAYINNNSPSADPFFMYLSYNAPHTPLQAPAAEIAQFKQDNPNFESLVLNSDYINNSNPVAKGTSTPQELTEKRIVYATMVANMDANIGRVVSALQNKGELENTLIIFLSDNGGYTFSKGAVNYPLDALKGSVKEGGHKVPMFIHWPDQINSGATFDHQISSLDLYPTLVDLAGGTVPSDKTLDGVSFMDNVLDGVNARQDEPLIIMRPQNGFHNGGMVKNQWKIVKTGGNGSWKLYNILNDPGESTDLRSTEQNAEAIIQELMDDTVQIIGPFKSVKPQWYDNDGDGSGHPHSFLWNDGTLPAYDKLFESSALLPDDQAYQIDIDGTTNAIEGGTTGIFTVSLPNGVTAPEDISLTYISNGLATSGQDYTSLSGSVTISSGQNSATIQIVAAEDNTDEGSETLQIQLNSTSFGSIGTASATIQILDLNSSANIEYTFDGSDWEGWTGGGTSASWGGTLQNNPNGQLKLIANTTKNIIIYPPGTVSGSNAEPGTTAALSGANKYMQFKIRNISSEITQMIIRASFGGAYYTVHTESIQLNNLNDSNDYTTYDIQIDNTNWNESGTTTKWSIAFRNGTPPTEMTAQTDPHLLIDKILISKSSTLSASDIVASKATIYPNPVAEFLNIHGVQHIEKVEIFNLLGVNLATFKGKVSMPVNNIDKGIYLAKITHGKTTSIRKFLKK